MTSARRFVITLLSLLAIWAVQGTPVSALGECVVCYEDCPPLRDMIEICEKNCPEIKDPNPECSVINPSCGGITIECEEPN